MKHKILTFLLALTASVGMIFAETYSGTCGENLTWTLTTEDGVLAISGSGEMENYNHWDVYYAPWNSYRSSITEITIGNHVTSIGDDAFSGCSSLTSVTIPNSVTSIGDYAFTSCSLTSVAIGNSVTNIGREAFYYCSSLNSVTFGESVTSIGLDAFKYCVNLTSVVWNAKKCGNFGGNTPFYYGSSSYGFDLRKQVTSFTFGETVESIPAYLCAGMTNLTSVTIPNSVTSIGSNAFSNTYLTSVMIGESVTNIGQYAFFNCSSLTSVTIPNSVTSIGDGAFSSCSGLTSITIGESVTDIGASAFANCSGLTSVTIPNSVTSIGGGTFSGCSSLTSVTIGESVTSIGGQNFYGCSKLASVVWNAKKCNDFSSNITPFYESTTSLYNFDIRKQISSFTFSDKVKSIPAYLCAEMTNLTSVTIPNSVTTIGKYAFSGCSGLTSLTIGNSLENIGYYAFSGCSNITSNINLNRVTTIRDYAFYSCSGLTKVTNLNNVETIGQQAFYGCSHITSDINLNSVETIGQQAFYGCRGLSKVVIGDNATSIGQDAFRGCTYLEEITIGSGINVDNGIGAGAFYGCRYLLSVTCKATFPPAINENVFGDCGVLSGVDLYVPEESVKRYKKADVWSEFNIIGKVIVCGTIETTDGTTVWEDELPFTWEDKTFTEAGTQTTTLKNMDGCDSVVTFTLRVRYNNIVLQENESSEYYDLFAQDYNGQRVTTATLNRQFTQGKWATLCLPFNVNKAMMMSLGLYNRVFAFRYAQQLDDETIQVFFTPAQSIEAGKGYIVNPNAKLAAKTSFVFPNVTINTDSDNGDITTSTGYNDGTGRGNLFLVGTLRTGILQGSTTGNTYLGLKDNQLYYPNTTAGTSIRAYRAVFRSDIPVNASRVRIIADGETVSELQVVGTAPSDWSDKSDPSYTPARKYIRNGLLFIERNGITYTAQGHRLD